ncbi:MAG: hypothetical protein ABI588_08695 [Arenimonas sp.]
MTERTRLSLCARSFSGWEALRVAVAGALAVPVEQVRGLEEPFDPAVRIVGKAMVMGFRLSIDLYIDPLRAKVPRLDVLAVELARRLGVDIAHHDGSISPYSYVLVRPNGERLALDEDPDADPSADGLMLDETTGSLRPLRPLP